MTGAPIFFEQRCAVSESHNSRKHELECLRLAADFKQLARDVRSPTLRSHFRRMAKAWATPEWAASADIQTEN